MHNVCVSVCACLLFYFIFVSFKWYLYMLSDMFLMIHFFFCLYTQDPVPLIQKCDHHSEFVLGFDFNLFVEGLVASCAWDRYVSIWNINDPPPFPIKPVAAR